jgi:hypothetical protein
VSGICVDHACAATAPVDAGVIDSGKSDAAKDAGSDGRVMDSGKRDAAKDAGEEPTPDAGEKVDAVVRPTVDASSDGLVVGGGGFSCAASPGSSGGDASLFGLFVGIGLMVVRRRRAA